MRTKYSGTLTGLLFALPGLLTLLGEDILVFCFIPIIAFLPIALPLELLGNELFSSYSISALFALSIVIIAFGLTSYYFFKRLKKDRDEDRVPNRGRYFGYFGIQLIIIHPMIFYLWALNNSENAGDGQFIFGAIQTFPLSSGLFVVLGLLIDFVKNKETLTKPS